MPGKDVPARRPRIGLVVVECLGSITVALNTWILTAALATGQVMEMPANSYQEVQSGGWRSGPTTQTWTQTWSSNGGSSGWQESRPSFLGRVREFFTGRPESSPGWVPMNPQSQTMNQNRPGCPCNQQPAQMKAQLGQPVATIPEQVPVAGQAVLLPVQNVMPRVTANEPPLAETPSALPTGNLEPISFRTESPVSQQISPRFANRIGHEEDYSWVTGQLFQVDGRWVIRYVPDGAEDRFGGSVVLTPEVEMGNFRAGDLVSARGQVVNPSRSALPAAGPFYRAATVDLIER